MFADSRRSGDAIEIGENSRQIDIGLSRNLEPFTRQRDAPSARLGADQSVELREMLVQRHCSTGRDLLHRHIDEKFRPSQTSDNEIHEGKNDHLTIKIDSEKDLLLATHRIRIGRRGRHPNRHARFKIRRQSFRWNLNALRIVFSVGGRHVLDEHYKISLDRKFGCSIKFALTGRVAGDRARRHGFVIPLFWPAILNFWAVVVAQLFRFRDASVNGSIWIEQTDKRVEGDQAHGAEHESDNAAHMIVVR
ncbi:hypothetical protein A1351_05810 [Methylosinus sp. R-45379]|nr:hypothetical protein A1351_05810 [Methylosinus sp. R-45379]